MTRKILSWLVAISLLLIIFFLSGLAIMDWLNLPLLPVDFLNPMCQLEISVQFPTDVQDWIFDLLREERGVTISIHSEDGNRVEGPYQGLFRTDVQGDIKVYLPRSRYFVNASVRGLRGTEFYRFDAEQDGSRRIAVDLRQPHQKMDLMMYRNRERNVSELLLCLKDLIALGEITRGYEFAVDQASRMADDTVNQELNSITTSLTRLLEMCDAYRSHAIEDFNSRITIVADMMTLLRELRGEDMDRPLRLQCGDFEIYPDSHLEAIREARNDVITRYSENFHRFLEIKAYMDALQMWLRVVGNPEIFQEDLIDNPDTLAVVQSMREKVGEITPKVEKQLLEMVERGYQHYIRNEIEEGWGELNLFCRKYPVFKAGINIPESRYVEAGELLVDIGFLQRANRAYEEHRSMDALRLYLQITHRSDWINGRIRNLQKESTP